MKGCLRKLTLMPPLRLAVFNTQPPHLYFGGVERRIIEVAKRISRDVDTKVYSGTKKGFNQPFNLDGLSVVPRFSTDLVFPLDNWFFNRSLAKTYDEIKADIFEAHTASGYGFLRAAKKRGTQKPFIQTIHGVLADEYVQSRLRGPKRMRDKLANFFMQRLAKIEEKSAKEATLIVTISKYSAEKIKQFYDVNMDKVRIVPNGVDPQRFRPFEDCTKIKNRIGLGDKQCVLFVGSLIPRKGLLFLVEAAKIIVRERSETMFVVVGEGPMKNHVMADLDKMNLSKNFFFLDHVKEEMLASLYSCADVFAFPSIQEGQGITLLEAQASATPVVSFNLGGIKEAVLNKETGLLVEPRSEELAEAILSLLSNDELREKMGTKGRSFVSENLSWALCAKRMLKVYREALQ